MRSLLLTVIAFFSIIDTAYARCATPVVTIHPGKLSDYRILPEDDLREFLLRYEVAPLPGHVLVVSKPDNAAYVISRDRIGEAVLATGGNPDGFYYFGPSQCEPADIPIIGMTVAASGDRTGPASNTAETILVKAGLWALQIGEPFVETCPDMMKASMGQSLSSTLTSFFSSEPSRISGPFHPDQLHFSSETETTWTSNGAGKWHGKAYGQRFALMPAGAGGGSGLSWDLKILNETEIQHTSRMTIVMPPETVVTLGGDTCEVASVSHWVRVGD